MANVLAPLHPEDQDKLYLPRVDDIRSNLRESYDEDLLYHGPGHEYAVVSRNLANRAVLLSLDIPMTKVGSEFRSTIGPSGHDAGFLAWFRSASLRKRFESPEEYAMFLTARACRKAKVDPFTTDEIISDQYPTKADERCVNWPQFSLCISDLHNTTLVDRTAMIKDTCILRPEYAFIKGEDLGEVGYRLFSLGLLATYHQVNLDFPGIYEAGEEFVQRRNQMGRNIVSMWQDTVKLSDRTPAELAEKLPTTARHLLQLEEAA